MSWLLATFITVKPALLSSLAEEGSARKVKQPSAPYGAHFGEPSSASVPSRFAKTMSPCRYRRMPANVEDVAPWPTSATSPPATIVNEPPGFTDGRPNAPASGTAHAATRAASMTVARGRLTAGNYGGNR